MDEGFGTEQPNLWQFPCAWAKIKQQLSKLSNLYRRAPRKWAEIGGVAARAARTH